MLSSHQGIPQPILLYIFLRFYCFHCMFSADKWLSVRGRLVHQRVRVSPKNCCFGHLSLRMLLACFRGARADKHWPNKSWNMISRLGYYRKVLYILWLSLLGCFLSVCQVLVRAPRRSLGGFQRVVVLSACRYCIPCRQRLPCNLWQNVRKKRYNGSRHHFLLLFLFFRRVSWLGKLYIFLEDVAFDV